MEFQEEKNKMLSIFSDDDIDINFIINENKVKNGENLDTIRNKLLIEKAENSICEIILRNEIEPGYGSGFFCKIKYPDEFDEIIFLFTNHHVIKYELLYNKDNYIIIKIKNEEKKIFLNYYRKIWADENLDFAAIEIIEQDNIIQLINTFEIDQKCFNINFDQKEYNKKGIVIASIGLNKKIELSQGALYYRNTNNLKQYFFHDCNTAPGFSGSPIILINNLKIIGIHKGNNNSKANIGIYFKEILNYINKEKEKIKENKIKGILDIKLNEIKDGVILLNQNEINKEEIKNNIIVYLMNKRINTKIKDNKWIINYNFEKDGSYEFTIIFKKKLSNLNSFFENCSLLSIDLSYFDTSEVNNMGGMFNYCQKLKEIKGLNRFNTSQVYYMRIMFQDCHELVYLDLTNFDTSNVKSMEGMFNFCLKLKEIKGLDNFNTSKVTNMSRMFENCEELENLNLSKFDTSKVTNITGMFNNCYKIRNIIGLNRFNTSQVINMDGMFQGCNELKYLDLSSFDTSKVIDFGLIFNNCHKIIKIVGLNKFNTSQVNNMAGMFQECNELESLDLSNFNTSKVKNMKCIFSKCHKIIEIVGLNKFNTSQVIDMNGMFNKCYELEYLDLSNFDTSKVIDFKMMFADCKKLNQIKGINKFITSQATNISGMFLNCNELIYLDLSNYDTKNVTDMGYMFYNCKNLRFLNLSNFSLKEECITERMFLFFSRNCEFITNNEKLRDLYNSFNCNIF